MALENAVEALRAGEAVCVFPEGGLSWGERLRARSGVGRLARLYPDAQIALCSVEGTTVRFPRRPRVRVSFLRPAERESRPDEEPAGLAARLLEEVRERVPPTPAGRRTLVGGPTSARAREERATPACRS